jgi:Sulfotransferase family
MTVCSTGGFPAVTNGTDMTDLTPGVPSNVVFLHIPKTAGSSFTRILKGLYDDNAIFHKMDSNALIEHLQSGEMTNDLYIGHYYYNVVDFFDTRPMLLTFLREPRDRVLSHYYYYKGQSDESLARLPPWDQHIVELTRQYSFADFISQDLPEIEKAFSNLQTRHIANSTDFEVPTSYTGRAKLVFAAEKHLKALDFVGIVDRFEDSLRLFQHLFNLEQPLTIPKVNVNARRPLDIDERAIFNHSKIARRRIELDQELYNLGLKLLNKQLRKLDIENGSGWVPRLKRALRR